MLPVVTQEQREAEKIVQVHVGIIPPVGIDKPNQFHKGGPELEVFGVHIRAEKGVDVDLLARDIRKAVVKWLQHFEMTQGG